MIVKAVAPYQRKNNNNFKFGPYYGWKANKGQIAGSHYPYKRLHGVFYNLDFPTFTSSKKEARLRFVEPVSLYFDTFPDYMCYEIIPFFWDVWPKYQDKVCNWLKRHKVKTAIFTSSQVANLIKDRFPKMNVMFCPEAIDPKPYSQGRRLRDRDHDYLEYGRCFIDSSSFDSHIKVLKSHFGRSLKTREELYNALGNSKITLCLSKFHTDPDFAGGIDTLTQRFWEGLLSRTIVVGHAPKELVDLVGYNPIIELDEKNINDQICEILAHINDYQELVDKNRETALKKGDWSMRMGDVMRFLEKCGYNV